jgi:hypothetical protein
VTTPTEVSSRKAFVLSTVDERSGALSHVVTDLEFRTNSSTDHEAIILMEVEWSEMSVFWRHLCSADFVRIFCILVEQKLFNLVGSVSAIPFSMY